MPDDSYEAGYRAGHLQGWLDAMAKVAGQAQNPHLAAGKVQAQVQAPAPAPAPAVPPTFAPPWSRLLPSACSRTAKPPCGTRAASAIVRATPRPKPATQPVPYRRYAGCSARPAESAESWQHAGNGVTAKHQRHAVCGQPAARCRSGPVCGNGAAAHDEVRRRLLCGCPVLRLRDSSSTNVYRA